jgi:DNA-binding NtrC family response regulator
MITAEQGITQPVRPSSSPNRARCEIVNFVQQVAVSEASSFLIEGENGTGKDLVVTTLHYQSPRKNRRACACTSSQAIRCAVKPVPAAGWWNP